MLATRPCYNRHVVRTIVPIVTRRYASSQAANVSHARQTRASLNMATARKAHVTTDHTGVLSLEAPTKQSAEAASRILQENHEKYNLFFNNAGFHNHIVHQVLTLYGLGAPAEVLEKHYEANQGYQQGPKALHPGNVEAMQDRDVFKKYLGKMEYTHDYLEFFTREIEKKGVEATLQEYLFSGDETAEDLLARLFAGFLHPLIHLGFGLEFNQPLVIAEALAETAVHDNWIRPFFVEAEKQAAQTKTSKSLPELLEDVHADKKLSTAAEWDDANKIRDGILARAPQEMLKYAAQFKVQPNQLAEKTAEMTSAAIFYTAAAQNPPKQIKFDFYFMHCVNSSVFWPTINAIPWLSTQNKIRLLEWKGRMDLVMYASRRSPKLLGEEIAGYVPNDMERGSSGSWLALARRLYEIPSDDGHAVKLLRAVAHGEEICKPFDDAPWEKIKSWQWLKIGEMVTDSVVDAHTSNQDTWARSVGFAEAWEDVKDRPRSAVL